MGERTKFYYYIDDDENVIIRAGDIVANSCRPSEFFYGMFGLTGTHPATRKTNYRKIVKKDYVIWSTIFNEKNYYNNDSFWFEEINEADGIITRTREVKDNNFDIWDKLKEWNLKNKFLVFSRVLDNSFFKFHGIYQYDKTEIKDDKVILYYKRVGKVYKYKFVSCLKHCFTFESPVAIVDSRWLD